MGQDPPEAVEETRMTQPIPYHFKDLKPKRSKYGNRRVEFNGMKFDSILERDRYIFLLEQERCGLIKHLERQPLYELKAYYRPICKFIPDHRYRITGTDRIVVEDVKGGAGGKATMTYVFRIKRALFEAQTNHTLHIVTKQNLTSLPCP